MSSGSGPLRRVLVANRGEIAVRVIRGCRERDIETVAVFSEADRAAPHVWIADQAIEIGPAPSRDSYLDVEKILNAAHEAGADAIHPGYGFLAENAGFAEAVEDAGLVWIGPPAEAIRAMGEKTAARRTMEDAGVPVIPGTVEAIDDAEAAAREADRIGFPVLLKAAAGGGGKGMRVVRAPADLARGFRAASSEAESAFGDPSVYLERYLAEARHVEIQVIADSHGSTLHLGERECSLQRRHQKILEECPAPGVSQETRRRMGQVAVQAAEAVGYVGAGTVEFLLTPEREFYFLEMNTRLQVEHPVTEMVTGVDLVHLQLAIAGGESLPFEQADVEWDGHAVECRIAAEDAENGFLPATGRIERYREPGGPGVRFDSGVTTGVTVSPHYDPLLAKCVAAGATREQALDRMARALAETTIGGVTTNLGFQRALVDHPALREGALHTAWLEANAAEIVERIHERRRRTAPLAAALAAWRARVGGRSGATRRSETARERSGWRDEPRWVWYR
ncbi:MAG: acetyl-CoA carboxylase biotin carboxylase subunit [Gemmatimonadota bacterium]|nr:acetyl-CoA carboxylase biotin carboxylase subunit [Gemmatimonadota bacterium]